MTETLEVGNEGFTGYHWLQEESRGWAMGLGYAGCRKKGQIGPRLGFRRDP